MKIYCACIFFWIGGFVLSSYASNGERYASHSVLAEGKWIKIKIEKTGIYAIPYTQLRDWGLDPEKVSVHGYGGWPLEEDFSEYTSFYCDDLPATAVWRRKEQLLFYGRGPVKWEYDPAVGRFVHTNNPYATAGYYFITDATETKEMSLISSSLEAALRITTFDDYVVAEKDLVSVNKSGRELFGESLLSGTATVAVELPAGRTADKTWVDCRAIARTFQSDRTLSIEMNNRTLLERTIPSVSYDNAMIAYCKAEEIGLTGTWAGEKDNPFAKSETAGSVKLKINCSQTAVTSAYLDYIRIGFKRTLKTYSTAYTFFRSLSSIGQAARFVIQHADANTAVWDVTDPLNPVRMETSLSGSEMTFTIPAGSQTQLREFALLQLDKPFATFVSAEEIAPQDLHAHPQPDMVIITPPSFRSEAERLKRAHEERDGLKNILVVTPEEIYNEFSSGTPDATAYRRLMKMFYDRRSSAADAPRFLLLLGDGAYDNRFVSKDWFTLPEGIKQNMLLTYQTQNSLNHRSYVSDDYFGILEDTDGMHTGTNTLKVGIGRFPVRTAKEARQTVDKVIGYLYDTQKGAWKNNLCFIGDDGSNLDNYATYHMTQADQLAESVENSRPEYRIQKVYFDAYKKEKASKGAYPDVKKRIEKELKDGLLLLDYVGHGNTQSLSDEQVINHADILKARYPSLPLWITATCDFCRFDDRNTSAGENVFLNEKSGGIALFTTSRVADAFVNFPINQRFIKYLFQEQEGAFLTLGEVMSQTKNEIAGIEKWGFCLIGDPALRLAQPEHRIKITSVNGVSVKEAPEPFLMKSLERVTVEGEIVAPSSPDASDQDFNGTLDVTVLDSRTEITTLGNNKVLGPVYNPETGKYETQEISQKITYKDYPYVIFKRNCPVENGRFRFSFTVPKDISYSSGPCGKMSLYAWETNGEKEAQGYFDHFRVGGTATHPQKDTQGPEIRSLYLNDSTFVEGGQVNTTPLFVARLWDQTGVNITGSSVGHDIMLTVDNNPVLSYTLNAYYSTLDDGKEGIVVFSVPPLSPGLHTAEFKVWDILNQSTTRTFTFEVVTGLKPHLAALRAVPGIAREQIQFLLTHNRPESELDVSVFVYDMAGRLKWNHTEHNSSELFQSYPITWDLCDNSGRRLRPGVYICRAAIRSNASQEATEAIKVIVLAP